MAEPDPDPSAVLAALGLPPGAAAERATGGFDTVVWRIEQRGRCYALRLLRPGQDKRCRREASILEAAAAHGLPVPRVHAHGWYGDRPALLLDWLTGRTMLAELRARPERALVLGRLFGAMQATIHAVPAPRGLDVDPWRAAAGPLGDQLPFPPLLGGALLHLDYHPLNVLTDGEAVTGVIDWANARAGDPRADLARTMTILQLALPGHADLVPPHVLAVLPLFDLGWRRRYARVLGRLHSDLLGAAMDGPGASAGPRCGGPVPTLAGDRPAELAPFFAWAGAAMESELAGRRGPEFLRRVQAWTDRWALRAGAPIAVRRRPWVGGGPASPGPPTGVVGAQAPGTAPAAVVALRLGTDATPHEKVTAPALGTTSYQYGPRRPTGRGAPPGPRTSGRPPGPRLQLPRQRRPSRSTHAVPPSCHRIWSAPTV